ncbi:MAG: pantetheine-phosphate adenylyltransferase [Bacteroidota bacterium]|jgi:pantetheine-phosphate adenylyltransferase
MEKRIAVFAGSFDPFTIGHESIARRSLPLFDELIIAIGVNSSKKYMFPLKKRLDWIKEVFRDEKKIRVDSFEGLTVDFCKSKNARFIVRGLRTTTDFEFEKAIAQMNRALNHEMESIFILPLPEHSAINSTIIRDIVKNGGDASAFVPSCVDLKI